MSSKVTNAASKSIMKSIFSKENFKYIFTTHFWGPVSNFGIPIAAVMDLRNKPAESISGPMTLALTLYSAVFMRYSMAISPKNYLLLGCHIVNEAAQLGQGFRYIDYNYLTKDKPASTPAAGPSDSATPVAPVDTPPASSPAA